MNTFCDGDDAPNIENSIQYVPSESFPESGKPSNETVYENTGRTVLVLVAD
jgi:hypothetical protein